MPIGTLKQLLITATLHFPGDIEVLQNLLIDGYDHIMDASDQITTVAKSHGHANVAKFLESVAEFEVIYWELFCGARFNYK